MSDSKYIVSFSGGKDSTAMLLKMIELDYKIDRIIMVDTTKEFPEMYEHIRKVADYIKPKEIEIIKIDYDYWFSEYEKMDGSKGYGWASFHSRWCTALKQEAIKETIYNNNLYDPRKRYSRIPKENNIIEYHGIAYDEQHRCGKHKKYAIVKYPLIEFKMNEHDCLEYCYKLGFNWDGLYELFPRVSCYCCPLGSIKYFRQLYKYRKDMWNELKKMDLKQNREFKKGYTVMKLEDKFRKEGIE